MSISRETWEEEYGKGRWDYLRSVPEMARYAVIAAYIHRFAKGGDLYDVGGGECVLSDYLDWTRISRYTSIDLSANAAAKARLPVDKARLITGDIEEYQLPEGERFDIIVFNEVLSYPKNPLEVLESCIPNLSENGIVIVSLWRSEDPNTGYSRTVDAVWRGINTGPWRAMDETTVTNVPTRRTWKIRVMSAAK